MADVELVVKLSEDIMEYIKNNGCLSVIYNNEIAKAIINGTPLPKGHGDLITRDQAIELIEFYQMNPQHFDFINLIGEMYNEKAVIEEDKGE